MKFFRNLLLLAALIAALLYFNNPSTDDFLCSMSEYVRTKVTDDTLGEYELRRAFGKAAGQTAGVREYKVEREDYQFWSMYTLRLDYDEHVFLGVAGQFILVESVVLTPS